MELLRLALVLVALIATAVCGYCVAVATRREVAVATRHAFAGGPALPRPDGGTGWERPPPPLDPPPSPPDNEISELLIRGLIGAYDVSTDEALRAHVEQVLSRAGVRKVMASVGEPWTPTKYNAVQVRLTDDPRMHNTVEKTVRPGWYLGEVELRSPEVEIWQGPQANQRPSARLGDQR